MKTNVNFSQFTDRFHSAGRGNQFSYDALQALYDYLTGLEEDMETEFELDVIALCCSYAEYESIEEFQKDYGEEYETIEEIEERTQVIRIGNSDSFIVEQF